MTQGGDAGAKVEVTYLPSGKSVRVPAGTTLFNAAHWAGLPIESTCGGRGTCGKCKVLIEQGAFRQYGLTSSLTHASAAQPDELEYFGQRPELLARRGWEPSHQRQCPKHR